VDGAGTRDISYARKNRRRKRSNRRRHSPFEGWNGSVGIPDTPAAERIRIVASSSDASWNVLRPISPQLGPSGHLAIYQNVYYVPLACYTVEPPSPIIPFFAAPRRRRLRNVCTFFVAPATVMLFLFLFLFFLPALIRRVTSLIELKFTL